MESTDQFVKTLRQWVELFMHRSMSGFIAFAKDRGLSMSQVGALFHLGRKGTVGVSDIGEDLGITSAAASQMLDRLVQQDLIARSEDPKDRRAKQIVLTERGQQIIRESMEARQRWFAALAAKMTPQERELAVSGLRILITKTGKLEPDVHTSSRPAKESSRQ